MILLVLMSASFLLAALSEYVYRLKSAGWLLFAAASVVALSVVNLIRDYSIGTDVGVYGNYIFTSAVLSSSLDSFLRVCDGLGNVEYGYGLLNYLVAFFTDSPHVFYFVLGLLTNGVVYCSLCRLRSVSGVALGWLVYVLMFFPTTLNAMRQSVAVAVVLLAVAYAMDSRLRASAIALVVAYFFHRSAVFGILMVAAAYLWTRRSENASDELMRLRRKRLLVFMVLAAMLLPSAIELMNAAGLLGAKYVNYLDGGADKDLLNPILVRLPFVLLAVILLRRDFSETQAKSNLVLVFMIMEMFLLPLQLVSDAAFRISLYLGIFKVVAYPAAVNRLSGSLHAVGRLALVAYLIFVFWWQIVLNGSSEVWPFLVAAEFRV